MSFTYVIPDIHGRYDLLCGALADISTHSGGGGGVIVTVGDYVDKGPHSKQVIDRLSPGIPGWNFVALKGNHDAMMVAALRDPAGMASWMEKGGDRRRSTPMAATCPPCRKPTSPGSTRCG